MDIVGAILGLVLLSPVMLAVALAVRLKLGRPVLFVQERAGLHGRPFRLYKFRTMTDARDAEGRLLPDADRLTPFGQWLRSTSLDELPTLWNVLKGDMSLVGPRPLLPEYLPLYRACELLRLSVRPGITGWAQINGRNAIDWDTKFALDVWYVKHSSFLLDIKILLMTIVRVIRREGIHSSDHATMPALHEVRLPAEPCRTPATGQPHLALPDSSYTSSAVSSLPIPSSTDRTQ